MKGVILAGGTGSRLYPLTKVSNKHLLPVGDKPMIQHCVEKLTEADIYDILVVTGGDHIGHIAEFLGSGAQFGCSITYKIQEEAGGIAQALGLAKGFVREGESMCVILGDNLFQDDLRNIVYKFERMPESGNAMVVLKEVDDPDRFGVANLEPCVDGVIYRDLPASRIFKDAGICGIGDLRLRISSIEEKPTEPKSNYAVTGVYFYEYGVFDLVDGLEPSGRGELEITDVNNAYLLRGKLCYDLFDGWWTDAGTHESYQRANRLVSGCAIE